MLTRIHPRAVTGSFPFQPSCFSCSLSCYFQTAHRVDTSSETKKHNGNRTAQLGRAPAVLVALTPHAPHAPHAPRTTQIHRLPHRIPHRSHATRTARSTVQYIVYNLPSTIQYTSLSVSVSVSLDAHTKRHETKRLLEDRASVPN